MVLSLQLRDGMSFQSSLVASTLVGFLMFSSSAVQAAPTKKPVKAQLAKRTAAAKSSTVKKPGRSLNPLRPIGRMFAARKAKRAVRKAALQRSSRSHIYQAHKFLGALGATAGAGAVALLVAAQALPEAAIFSPDGFFETNTRYGFIAAGAITSVVSNFVAYVDARGVLNEQVRLNTPRRAPEKN